MAPKKETLDTIKSPAEARRNDPIAKYVIDAYRAARTWRASLRIGNDSVETVLNQCYQQYHAIITPDEAALMEEANVRIKVSLTRYKVDILVAWLRDLFQNTSDAPFLIAPTPIPELSDSARAEVRATITQGYMPNGVYPSDAPPPPLPGGDHGEVTSYIQKMRERQLKLEGELAKKRADNMQQLIDDQLVEGKFQNELTDYLTHFATYPYAVMLGPMVERRPFLRWNGNKTQDKFENTLVCKNISPFDYFWSSDTKEGGKGSYDLIRERVTKQYLLECAKLPGYIRDNVVAAIEDYNRLSTDDWMNDNPTDSDARSPAQNPPTDTVTILRFFGKMNGRTLKQYGVSGVDDLDYVEIEAIVLGDYTLRIVVSKQPLAVGRPIYVSSYNKTPGMLPGYSIAQTIRPYEQMFMAFLRNAIMNAGYSAAPMGEVNVERIQQYMQNESAGQILPGRLIPTAPDLRGGQGPAHQFFNIPSSTVQLTQGCSWIMQQIDQITGLPAALAGQPVGTGVNRTFRGIAQLYANALKGVQSALVNLDQDMFQPIGNAYFVYNMRYSDDDRVKGDCKVMSRGLAGLLQKELDKQHALDTLQVLGPLLQTGKVPDGVTEFAIKQALLASGIPEDVWDEAAEAQKAALQAQAQAASQAPQPSPQGAPEQPGAPPPPPALRRRVPLCPEECSDQAH